VPWKLLAIEQQHVGARRDQPRRRGRPRGAAADDDELDRLDMAADLRLNSRLGCQAVITRPVNYVVEIPGWNRNYVSEGKPSSLA
jgi:2Fe-2S ferredoxin